MKMLDFLQAQPEVDNRRIGVTGLSMGGVLSALLGALDQRVKATFVSGGFLSVRGLLTKELTMPRSPSYYHSLHTFIPGFVEKFYWPDILAMVAPRPLLLDMGFYDEPLARYENTHLVTRAYEALEASERFSVNGHDGPHVYSVDVAVRWFLGIFMNGKNSTNKARRIP
jgi:dienelactone hydrolase